MSDNKKIPSCADRSRRPHYSLHFESAVREYDAACATHLGKHVPDLKHFTKNRPIDHDQFVKFVKIDSRFRPTVPQYSPGPKPKVKRKRKKKLEEKTMVPWHLPPSSNMHATELVVDDSLLFGDVRPYAQGQAPWHMPPAKPQKKMVDTSHSSL
mmetsp:Transcript_30794/g.74381  ORF Transcript_30794/g.74381 Transcript_30794/m.74381 type:complete len:154 (+) Transcript_30794:44-505(+)